MFTLHYEICWTRNPNHWPSSCFVSYVSLSFPGSFLRLILIRSTFLRHKVNILYGSALVQTLNDPKTNFQIFIVSLPFKNRNPCQLSSSFPLENSELVSIYVENVERTLCLLICERKSKVNVGTGFLTWRDFRLMTFCLVTFIPCYSNIKHFWSMFIPERKSKRTRRKVEEKSKECRRFFGPRKMACRFLEKIHTDFRETCEVWQWRPARFL